MVSKKERSCISKNLRDKKGSLKGIEKCVGGRFVKVKKYQKLVNCAKDSKELVKVVKQQQKVIQKYNDALELTTDVLGREDVAMAIPQKQIRQVEVAVQRLPQVEHISIPALDIPDVKPIHIEFTRPHSPVSVKQAAPKRELTEKDIESLPAGAYEAAIGPVQKLPKMSGAQLEKLAPGLVELLDVPMQMEAPPKVTTTAKEPEIKVVARRPKEEPDCGCGS